MSESIARLETSQTDQRGRWPFDLVDQLSIGINEEATQAAPQPAKPYGDPGDAADLSIPQGKLLL